MRSLRLALSLVLLATALGGAALSPPGRALAATEIDQLYELPEGVTHSFQFAVATDNHCAITVDWGDGTPLGTASWTRNADGSYTASASHAYVPAPSSPGPPWFFVASSPNAPACPALVDLVLSFIQIDSAPLTPDQCKDGGYANYVDPDTGQPFRNQGECVSWVQHNIDGHGNG